MLSTLQRTEEGNKTFSSQPPLGKHANVGSAGKFVNASTPYFRTNRHMMILQRTIITCAYSFSPMARNDVSSEAPPPDAPPSGALSGDEPYRAATNTRNDTTNERLQTASTCGGGAMDKAVKSQASFLKWRLAWCGVGSVLKEMRAPRRGRRVTLISRRTCDQLTATLDACDEGHSSGDFRHWSRQVTEHSGQPACRAGVLYRWSISCGCYAAGRESLRPNKHAETFKSMGSRSTCLGRVKKQIFCSEKTYPP